MQEEVKEMIKNLDLKPHPEGGFYKESFRDPCSGDSQDRGACTVIYFLLTSERSSHWHRVDAVEAWFWHAGAPLELSISEDGKAVTRHLLGAELAAGQRPHGIVPKDAWQAARTTGSWSLVSCSVAPGFVWSGFELASKGWAPSESSD